MTQWTPEHLDPVNLPPDIESIAFTYLTAIVAPTPVATRLPNPDLEQDTINDFLRIEAAGGNLTVTAVAVKIVAAAKVPVRVAPSARAVSAGVVVRGFRLVSTVWQ